jgi:F-type H+-transporting ATPase subunit a
MVDMVRNDIAIGVIGPDGVKYFPYLLSLFMFILVGNLFEVTPLVNFPITSRMAIPLFLALLTYVIFVFMGFKTHGDPATSPTSSGRPGCRWR